MLSLIVGIVATIGFATPAWAQDGPTRVALVIGNGAYRNVPARVNPAHDAADVGSTFERLGFSVRRITDGTYDDMRRALLDFTQRARGAEMAVVYFAGHGIEVGGENWLIPVDAALKTDLDIEQEAFGLRSVMLMVSTASKLGLVVLDACRNNPFLAKMRQTVLSRSVERGLGRVEPVSNVLVAYAAKDGTTAADGAGPHSPFTNALLKYLEKPGLEINFLFRSVRDEVIATTRNAQQPFVYGSLSKEAIYLKEPPILPTPDAAAWALLKETTDDAALKRFTREYPNSPLRRQAEERIEALAAAEAAKPVPPGPDAVTWLLLKETTDQAALKHFIEQYPNSSLRREAEARIAKLTAADAAKPAPPSSEEIAWSLVKDTQDPNQLQRFVEQFPSSSRRADAQQLIAALTSGSAKRDTSAFDHHELARSLQLELRRVGCFDGDLDGEFNDRTRSALSNFGKLAAISLPQGDLSLDTLKAVQGIDKRVCPLVCKLGERADGDRCVRTCPSGKLVKNGTCLEAPPRSVSGSPRLGNPQPTSVPLSRQELPKGMTIVDNSTKPEGVVTQGGVATCGGKGCQIVPKNCYAVTGVHGGGGLGGRIFCP
jgi:uncharacterized caspase-like protein